LTSGRREEATRRLEEAGSLPDNRLNNEPLRCRLMASVAIDSGRSPDLVHGIDEPERLLLEAEIELSAGRLPGAVALKELTRRLATPVLAGQLTWRLLEWSGRFARVFSGHAGQELVRLGQRASARAGLEEAATRFESLSRSSTPSSSVSRQQAVPAQQAAHPAPGVRIVVADPASQALFKTIARIAPTQISVLILGETGTGKEIVAREIHRLSRRVGEYTAVNMAGLPSTLVESELFGHARGAFTGADRDRIGMIEHSSSGTLFLDEIGDLPPPLQAKLLRVLQEREVRRVGETRSRPVDLRVLAATHRDLESMMKTGEFRADLYHRLAGVTLEVAPLRDRPLDLAGLLSLALGGAAIAEEARHALTSYSWPGNIRELFAALESARAMAGPGDRIEREHLPRALRAHPARPASATGQRGLYKEQLQEARSQAIKGALERFEGNRTRAAAALGISRQALLYELRKQRGRTE
jgi:transcriptional regulator with PAS, ATPase and Fis domain